jgi:hypothetical protein
MGEGQEGETSAAFLKIRATGFAGLPSANQKPFAALSSPGGEETGEGGRKTQISFAPIVHPKLNPGKEFPSVPPCGTRPVAPAEFGMRL